MIFPRFTTVYSGHIFSRAWRIVSFKTQPISHLPKLSTVYTFSRPFYVLNVFPPFVVVSHLVSLTSVTLFPWFDYMFPCSWHIFSHACNRFNFLPMLAKGLRVSFKFWFVYLAVWHVFQQSLESSCFAGLLYFRSSLRGQVKPMPQLHSCRLWAFRLGVKSFAVRAARRNVTQRHSDLKVC